MALTIERWLLLAGVACAMVWFSLLARIQPADKPETSDFPFRFAPPPPNPLQATERQLGRTNDRLRLLEIRDSIAHVAAEKPTPFTLLIDSAFAPATRARLEAAITKQWSQLTVGGDRRTVVAVVVDTTRRPHALPRSRQMGYSIPITAFPPSPNTGGACVSMIVLNRAFDRGAGEMSRQVATNLSSSETVQALLGTCALIAKFGEPGPGVSRWLFDVSWTPSRLAAWNDEPSPWNGFINRWRLFGGPVDMLALAADPAWQIRKYVAPSGVGCMAGQREKCRTILLGTPRAPLDSAWRAGVVSTSGTNLDAFYLPQKPTPLGPADGLVVSEMVRTLGPERFEKFWRSALPVEEAFKSAADQDIESWTREWARRMYGAATVGPAVSDLGLGTGLVVLAAGLGVAVIIGTRRRVI